MVLKSDFDSVKSVGFVRISSIQYDGFQLWLRRSKIGSVGASTQCSVCLRCETCTGWENGQRWISEIEDGLQTQFHELQIWISLSHKSVKTAVVRRLGSLVDGGHDLSSHISLSLFWHQNGWLWSRWFFTTTIQSLEHRMTVFQGFTNFSFL